MENPFGYGGVVGHGSFCNRTQELADLQEMMLSGSRCFVYAERRMGKTSLVLKALSRLSAKSCLPVYIDLWPTDGPTSFAVNTARALSLVSETRAGRMLELAKALFGRLRPSVTMDDAGKPNVQFGVDNTTLKKVDLAEVLQAPQELANRTKKKVIVVFDEFQQILQYGDDLVERQIRSSIQQHKNVSYVFLGSRKHLMQDMFLDQSRPLYRSAAHYPLGPIATSHWQPFIASRFRKADKKIDKQQITELCSRTEGHPFYTQHLCHVLWSTTESGGAVDDASINKAVDELLRRESHAYVTLWESLTRNEQRLLRGLANSESPPKPFSSDFTRQYGLRTSSNSQRAAESLLRKDVIDRESSSFVIVDRFLRLWIRALS
ncbi:MAG: ATP-binding protein [Planctomycetota bacterium]|nr:ATP-binding protein [Planctomycetota bacterium]